MCGLVPQEESSLIPALEIYHNKIQGRFLNKITSTSRLQPINSSNNSSHQKLILDSFTFKKGAIITALETAENLSNIGMILSC